MNQLIFDFARSDYPGFDKFLGTANRELIYVLQQAQDQFVYVWGQRGSGKSHLLKAWVAQAREQGHHAVYIDAETAPLDETALSAEYLAVDGADRLQADEQALLFEIFNRFRNGARGRLLLSADVPPQQLTVREDLRTRMGYCLVYDIKPLSDEEKIDALVGMAGARQLALEPEIFRYLLTYWRRDMDSLVQMLDSLCHYAATTRRRITLPLLEFGQPIFLVSDEPYATITYDGHQVPNVLDLYEHAIVVNSFSKSLGLAGERIGYIAVGADVPEVDTLMDALIFCNRTLGFNNAPALAQKVVAEYLDVLPDVADYQAKRDLLYKELTALGFETSLPEGAFYFFMKVPAGFESSVDFANYVADKHQILVVPGSGFGCEGYVRLSYCVKMEVVERSLKAWQALADELGLKK